MPIEEIKAQDWAKLCEKITHSLKEASVTVNVVDERGLTREVMRDLPLNSLVLEHDACNDRITLCAGTTSPVVHTVVEPLYIKIRRTEDGDFNPLEIEGENGITFVRFRPSLRSAFTEFRRAA